MRRLNVFALFQVLAGGAATLLVAFGYFWFNHPLQEALGELDRMAARAESEIATVEGLLTDIDGVAESVQDALPFHRESLEAIGQSTTAVARTMGEWEAEIPGIQDLATDTAHVCETFAAQLPIRVPAVDLRSRVVEYQLPEITAKTQEVEIPYQTAKVKTSTKTLTYPTGAKDEMNGFERGLGRVAGRSLGNIRFEYPSGITLSNGSVTLDYPSAITLQTARKTVSIPATPEVTMKDHSFEVPDAIEVTHRDLMKDEKAILEQSSRQLASMTRSLDSTRDSLRDVIGLLENDVPKSLDETRRNFEAAETALTTFRSERIPRALADLEEQRLGLNQSRSVFLALSGLIPLAFGTIALMCAAMAVGGVQKVFVARS
ncbi:hypothetical protein AB1L88_06165 [Tautonia sp. JC769]|uniref:hypothetical protein n=1 Tax=Tautonia sp. JC769 TaxID=3232135 RepID=UPI00345A42E9